MSEKNEISRKFINQKNDMYLLSSWNYGSYSPCNPYYKTFKKYQKYYTNTNPNNNQTKTKSNFVQKKITEKNTPSKKRRLKEEERIVTNEYIKSFNYYKKMQSLMKHGKFRPKSVTKIKTSNINNLIKNDKIISVQGGSPENFQKKQKKPEKELRTESNNEKKIKCKLTFSEWLDVKNKQRECINVILKKHKMEENKQKIENKKINYEYNKVKQQKIKEWLHKKHIESLIKKEIEKRIEDLKEEQKNKRLEKKEEVMNNWFKLQAVKMEKEFEEKKKKKDKEKKEKIRKKIEKEEKKIKGKEAFKMWRELKEHEMKEKKRKENINKQKEQQKKRKEYLKKRVKSFIIGPYTDAAALREIQNNLMENNLNNSDFGL